VTELVPPIPASCAHRPTVGGLVAPYVNVRLADGGVDFRSPDNTRYERVWREALCQTCARPLGEPGVDLAVFFGGPDQLAELTFDEPPLCTVCAVYASKACPMLAGRRTHYVERPRLADGHRGERCGIPGCGCAGWVETVTGAPEGGPAHPWYAVYARVGTWQLTAVYRRMPGYVGQRLSLAGGRLLAAPAKVVHVSDPGVGRIWQRQSVRRDTCPIGPTTPTS
jgi:hypothetical protein